MKHVYRMVEATDVVRVGGKAASLARLAANGFPPPEFFAIVPEAFDERGLKPDAATEVERALAELGSGPFAVRSSGRQEDGAAHSHAGQFLSKLNVPDSEAKAAAADVWRSGFTETIEAYRRVRGLADGTDAAPAVIVQRMVDARAAGVVFSADPLTGRRDRIVISATVGLADQLVSGEIDGTDYAVCRRSGAVTGPMNGDGPLGAKDIAALADLAVKVEAAFGAPQDIEWAFERDRLHVLQSRPITTKLEAAPAVDTTITIFDNSNIVESYPGLVSPLTYSFAQYAYARVYRAFVRMVGVSEARIVTQAAVFENMLGRVDGRVYYNLVNWYRCLALLPGFAINRRHMETMMGVGEPLPEEIAARLVPQATGLAKLREWGRVAVMVGRLAIEAIRLPRTIRGFYGRLERALGTDAIDLEIAPLTALAAEYRRIEAELLDRWDAPLINDFLCMMAFGASRKLMQRWLGKPGLALHNDVMIGQGDIVSAEPAQRIGKLGAMVGAEPGLAVRLMSEGMRALDGHGEIRDGVASYIGKFGDRCTEELKLESITLAEDPTQLLLAIAAAAGRPAVKHAAPRAMGDRLAELFPGSAVKRWIATRVLAMAKARVRDRENLRFERTRIFGRARRVFLAMGREFSAHGLIDAPRDVFLLTVPEVLGAIEGYAVTSDLRAILTVRRAEMARAAERPEPPERITITGAAVVALEGAAGHTSAQDVRDAPRSSATERKGTGCSAGRLTGTARVIRDPRTEALAPGEILVARHTDPGWIAVFSNAAAIVVERGSLLSHSAIVARELGIPCVVGLKEATQWIASGDTIEVDGSTGEVWKR